MKKYELSDITQMKTPEIVRLLETGKFSLLKLFKAGLARLEMIPAGILCRFALRLLFIGYNRKDTPKANEKVRKRALKYLPLIFKDKYFLNEDRPEGSLVVGFNHPSLHEVISLILFALRHYPGKRNCYPANLPIYECLVGSAAKLRRLNIYITLLITDSVENKVERLCKNDEQIMLIVKDMRERFNACYSAMGGEFAAAGDNTFAAPSGGRQATIFRSKEAYDKDPNAPKLPVAMGSLALSVARKCKDGQSVIFLPMTIVPPEGYSRLLNLFKTFEIREGKAIPLQQALSLTKKKYKRDEREFDHYFLKQLTEQAPESLWFPAVTE